MPNLFTVTTATNTLHLDRKRRGEAAFTVTNDSGRPLRGRALLQAEDPKGVSKVAAKDSFSHRTGSPWILKETCTFWIVATTGCRCSDGRLLKFDFVVWWLAPLFDKLYGLGGQAG